MGSFREVVWDDWRSKIPETFGIWDTFDSTLRDRASPLAARVRGGSRVQIGAVDALPLRVSFGPSSFLLVRISLSSVSVFGLLYCELFGLLACP